MQKYPDFWSVLLGNGNHGFFFGYVVLSLVSAIGIILIMATKKFRDNPTSPDQWSWKYFWADNLGKFIAGFFLLPVFVRLIYQYVDQGWMIAISIGLGFGFLGLAQVATTFGVWTTNRLSKQIADKINSGDTNTKP